MADETVGVTITGGQVQGIAGAGSVRIENFTIYNRPPDEAATPSESDEPIGPCPFPGLAFFGPEDADRFFGRDTAIERLVEAVGRQSLIALVGASGSGKSSVVLAGLAPRLHRSKNWLFSHFRIGSEVERDPFLALARALVPLFVASEDDVQRLMNAKKLGAGLQSGELTLRDVFAECRSRNKGRSILLIADQFEEVFTLIPDEAFRHHFIDVLLAGVSNPGPDAKPDICLMMTLRADFYGRALLHRPLADALQGQVENLGPMNRHELRAAILQPAESVKVSFEPGLEETLLDDVESRPGSLPLLQFALREMWGRQERRKITRKSYDAIGGVQGALAQRAESIFAELTEHGANARMERDFQRLFMRLVSPGEGQEDTRRVAERGELGDEAWSLAQRLAGESNRLVVTNAPGPGHETGEVVHEALIRHWPRLIDWINRDRVFLAWLRQIRSNLELWSADPSDEGPLLRGGMLAQATDWLERRGDDLSPTERSYIEASIAMRRRTEEERETARQEEIRRQRELAEAATRLAKEQGRRTRIAIVGVLVAVVLALFAGGAGYFAYRNGRDAAAQAERALQNEKIAKESERTAISGRLAADSLLNMTGNQELGLLLAVQAQGMVDNYESRNSLLLLLQSNTRLETYLHPKGNVNKISVDPRGDVLASAGYFSDLQLWDLNTFRPFDVLRVGPRGNPDVVAISPDGITFSSGSLDDVDALNLFNLSGKSLIRDLNAGLPHSHRIFQSVIYSPNGKYLLSAGCDDAFRAVCKSESKGIIRVWDVAKQQLLTEFQVPGSTQVYSLAFSPNGTLLAVGTCVKPQGGDGWGCDEIGIQLWETTDVGHPKPLGEPLLGVGFSVTFGPSGSVLATTGKGQVQLWDAASRTPAGAPFTHGADIISAIAFSRDGKYLATGTCENGSQLGQSMCPKGAILIWDLADVHAPKLMEDAFTGLTAPPSDIVFGPSDNVLFSAARGTINVWSFGPRKPAGKPATRIVGDLLDGLPQKLSSLAVSHDGTILATGGTDGIIRLWNTSSRKPLGIALTGHRSGVHGLAFSPAGSALMSAGTDELGFWDLDAVAPHSNLVEAHQGTNAVAFSPDGHIAASVDNGGMLYFWDADTHKQEGSPVKVSTVSIYGVAFSPSGSTVATVGWDGSIYLVDARTHKKLGDRLILSSRAARSIVFSPDGNALVVANQDGEIGIFDTKTRKLTGHMNGHLGEINAIAFSPDGDTLASGGKDGTVRLWDVVEQRPLGGPFLGHSGEVTQVAFAAKGSLLISGGGDGVQLLGHGRRVLVESFMPDRGAQSLVRRMATPRGTEHSPRQYLPSLPRGEGGPD